MAEAKRGLFDTLHSIEDAATCPANLLPWLAWAWSVEVWESDWPIERQRRVVDDAIRYHRIKGTRPAVEQSLRGLGFDTQITEWFEPGGSEQPYTFSVNAYSRDVFAAGLSIDADLLAAINRAIEHAKPARAHYTLRIGERHACGLQTATSHRATAIDRRRVRPRAAVEKRHVSVSSRAAHIARYVSRHTHQPSLPEVVQ